MNVLYTLTRYNSLNSFQLLPSEICMTEMPSQKLHQCFFSDYFLIGAVHILHRQRRFLHISDQLEETKKFVETRFRVFGIFSLILGKFQGMESTLRTEEGEIGKFGKRRYVWHQTK